MYAKVFSQMYDGTLCTKGPWQALVTFQQLLVLADQDGNVDMTEVAISRRTTIPVEIIHTGIVELLKEDDESRTPTMEGRRIIPLAEGRNWGWHIVNYKHYRELKREEDRREYHRGYWNDVRAPKLKAAKAAQQHSTGSTESTYAEADAEAKVDTKPPPKPKREKKASSLLPTDWSLSAEDRAFCEKERPDLNPEKTADSFRDYWISEAGRKADWPAAFRNWVRKERGAIGAGRGKPLSKHAGFSTMDYARGVNDDGSF